MTVFTAFLAVILVAVLALIIALPLAFFGMLFLGNVGVHLGFWACLPGAIAIKCAVPAGSSNNLTTKK